MNCTYCSKLAVAKGLCGTHYARHRRTGNAAVSNQGKRTVKTIHERIAENHVVLPNGCHEWTLGISQYGYGKVKYEGRTLGAHVVAYFLHHGEWPENTLDHTCHTLDLDCVGGVECRHRRCINPEHLEDCTTQENTRRRDLRRVA